MTRTFPVTGAFDPARCPLCGEVNSCGMAAGDTECWCFTAKVPDEVLARLPDGARGVVCVCRKCAEGAPAIRTSRD
jgi:hypothetical protein